MKRFARWLAAIVLSVAVFSVASASAATPAEVLTITPSSTRPAINPGGLATGSFQVIDQGTTSFSAKIYAAPYSVKGEDYDPDFTPLPDKPNPADWFSFNTTATNLKPNQPVTVRYTVHVPATVQAGGYYAVAFAETKPVKNGQGVIVSKRVGEIFYIQVAGKVRKSGKILDWNSAFLQKSAVSATLRLENDGGTDYDSNIVLHVKDIFGRDKYSLVTHKEVLPQTIRRVPFSWDKAPPLGLFKITGSATVFGQTQQLPTRYVLVASPLVRFILLGIVTAVAAYFGGRLYYKRGRAKTSRKE